MTVVTDDVEFAAKLVASGWYHIGGNIYIWPAPIGNA